MFVHTHVCTYTRGRYQLKFGLWRGKEVAMGKDPGQRERYYLGCGLGKREPRYWAEHEGRCHLIHMSGRREAVTWLKLTTCWLRFGSVRKEAWE
jgi:hypothetical protein